MTTLICKIPPHPCLPDRQVPFPKGGIPPYQRGRQGVVDPSLAITPSRKFFGTPPLKIRGGRGSYDPEGARGDFLDKVNQL
jgi:hypothetical protein